MFSRLSKTYAKLKSYVPRKVGFLKNKWEVGVTVPKKILRCCRKKIALDLKPYISVVNYNLAEKKIISLKMPIFLLPKKVCNLTDMQTLIRTLIEL